MKIKTLLDSIGFLQNSAEGDPLPIFLKFFYKCEIGKRRLEPVQDPSFRYSF